MRAARDVQPSNAYIARRRDRVQAALGAAMNALADVREWNSMRLRLGFRKVKTMPPVPVSTPEEKDEDEKLKSRGIKTTTCTELQCGDVRPTTVGMYVLLHVLICPSTAGKRHSRRMACSRRQKILARPFQYM